MTIGLLGSDKTGEKLVQMLRRTDRARVWTA